MRVDRGLDAERLLWTFRSVPLRFSVPELFTVQLFELQYFALCAENFFWLF